MIKVSLPDSVVCPIGNLRQVASSTTARQCRLDNRTAYQLASVGSVAKVRQVELYVVGALGLEGLTIGIEEPSDGDWAASLMYRASDWFLEKHAYGRRDGG